MFNRFRVLAATIILLMLTACSNSTPNTSEKIVSEGAVESTSKQKAMQTTVQAMPEYKIVEDEVKRDIKRTVEVELSARTDEETLKSLAEKIYALSNVKVKRTFIGYRIAGEDKNQAFWGTTNYNPDLEVRLLGKSAADYEIIKNTALPEGEILGSWMVGDGADYKITAYKKNGHTYIQSVHYIDKPSDKIYELSQSDKGIKLQHEDGNDQDGYFIINEKGDLEFWNEENGNYYTAQKN